MGGSGTSDPDPPAAPAMSTRADHIRHLFAVWTRDGLDAVLALMPDDVEWAPLTADGRRFDSAGLRAFFEEERRGGDVREFEVVDVEEIHDHVLVTGKLHVRSGDARVEVQPCLVYRFDGDRVSSVVGHPTRAAALAAIAGPPAGGTGP